MDLIFKKYVDDNCPDDAGLIKDAVKEYLKDVEVASGLICNYCGKLLTAEEVEQYKGRNDFFATPCSEHIEDAQSNFFSDNRHVMQHIIKNLDF